MISGGRDGGAEGEIGISTRLTVLGWARRMASEGARNEEIGREVEWERTSSDGRAERRQEYCEGAEFDSRG